MVVKCADFQPAEFFKKAPVVKNRRGNPAGKKRHYIGITTAFDIETTLLDNRQTIMYIWQWQFGEDVTVIGRTWEEFCDLQNRIKSVLPSGKWLVVYVHNLSYEFQFLKGIYTFLPSDIFATSSRKILKADMHQCFEFRCSYLLTNMSLGQFTKKMNVTHKKLSGEEFNYGVSRYPWSELTEQELEYCINDVWGLVEAVNALMARDGDTLQTIPLTSTGYVRRNVKRAMHDGNVHHGLVYSMLPDIDIYRALREAFRGGNTHSNRYFTGDIVNKVHSADRSSSYPAVICNCEFPMSQFIPIMQKDLNPGYISRCIKIRHKALLLRIRIDNLDLRDPFWGCPYLSKDKCRNIKNAVFDLNNDKNPLYDNGRILKAESLETTVTDIDLKIIMEEYSGQITFLQGWYASYKKLPQPIINEVISYYKSKTELKGVEGKEVEYDKNKALLNAIYGMMVQSCTKPHQIFKQIGDFDTDYSVIENDDTLSDDVKLTMVDELERELLGKYNEKAFLAYQWGVWVTAHARDALERGIRLVHETGKNQLGVHFIYCDTDSVKYTGVVNWDQYNQERIMECQESGAFATDPSGVTHYMGVFETEDNPDTGYAYYQFKTLGAKKYAYTETEGGAVHCTIAGVNKANGGKELDQHGGLSAFEEGFIFRDAGGVEAVYNDDPVIKTVTIDGHTMNITSNVSLLPSEYTLGITGEYARIIRYCKSYLYNPHVI